MEAYHNDENWVQLSDNTKLMLWKEAHNNLASANKALTMVDKYTQHLQRNFFHMGENYQSFQPYAAQAKVTVETMLHVVDQLGAARRDHPERFEHLTEEEIFHGAVMHELQRGYNNNPGGPNVALTPFDMYKSPPTSEMPEFPTKRSDGTPGHPPSVRLHKRHKRDYRPHSDDEKHDLGAAKMRLERHGVEASNENMVKLGYAAKTVRLAKINGELVDVPIWTSCHARTKEEKRAEIDKERLKLSTYGVEPSAANLCNLRLSKSRVDGYFAVKAPKKDDGDKADDEATEDESNKK